MSSVGVWSESGRLQACIGCAPGAEFDRVLPRNIEAAIRDSNGQLRDNPDYLLFDDLVLRDVLWREHQTLFDVIRAATGAGGVHDLRALVADVLVDPGVRKSVLADIAAAEMRIGGGLSVSARQWLSAASPRQCAEALMVGTRPDGQVLLRWPMPNALFARDCLAVVGASVVVMRPAHPARWRDGIISRAIARHHPLFAGVQVIDVADGSQTDAQIEGGDVLVVSEKLVLVGVGIRTNLAGARALAEALLPAGVEVLGVQLPKKRAAMHLDTLFTVLDEESALVFPPVVEEHSPVGIRLELFDPIGGKRLDNGLQAALAARGHDLDFVPCGDGDEVAAIREQWTDGANAFCLAPGRVLLYGRNRRTLAALNKKGFEIATPAGFIQNAALWLEGQRKMVIALDGFELSRGRGGPRCLTLPLSRAPLQ
ncbi:MAG: hypothetical protein KC502_13345 [Myxococcales bacterium]|nr:hypothetical protein [Myxococcales bacterium]